VHPDGHKGQHFAVAGVKCHGTLRGVNEFVGLSEHESDIGEVVIGYLIRRIKFDRAQSSI
jgi:hypothetical protein